MTALVRDQNGHLLPDLAHLLESPIAVLRSLNTSCIPAEEYVEDGRYTIRAELPGVGPSSQLDVTIAGLVLTITAERHQPPLHVGQQSRSTRRRSQFHYGVYSRNIALPADADTDDVTAGYDNGILTISVGLNGGPRPQRRITVTRGS